MQASEIHLYRATMPMPLCGLTQAGLEDLGRDLKAGDLPQGAADAPRRRHARALPGVRGLLAPAARRRIQRDYSERPVRQGAAPYAHTPCGTLISSLYDHVAQVMPVAKATLYTIKAVNGLAGIAQCFFPGATTGCKRGDIGAGIHVPCKVDWSRAGSPVV